MTLRARIYGLLDPRSHGHAARRVRALETLLILIGITSVSVGTVDGVAPAARTVAATVNGIVAALFFAEYLCWAWLFLPIAALAATWRCRETRCRRVAPTHRA